MRWPINSCIAAGCVLGAPERARRKEDTQKSSVIEAKVNWLAFFSLYLCNITSLSLSLYEDKCTSRRRPGCCSTTA
jgi:hypothetical protein